MPTHPETPHSLPADALPAPDSESCLLDDIDTAIATGSPLGGTAETLHSVRDHRGTSALLMCGKCLVGCYLRGEAGRISYINSANAGAMQKVCATRNKAAPPEVGA